MLFITPAVATAIITFCGLSSAKYIITKDCTEPVDYSKKIQDHFGIAFERMDLASTQMDRVWGGNPNRDVADVAGYLFKQQDYQQVSKRLKDLKDWGIDASKDVIITKFSNDKTKDYQAPQQGIAPAPPAPYGRGDTVIYCTAKRFTTRTQNGQQYRLDQHWNYIINDHPPENFWDSCFNGARQGPKAKAWVTSAGANTVGDLSPDVMQFCPWYLEKGINDPEPKTCTDLSQQAKRLLGKIKEQKKSNADGYSDFRHTITHELMHTKIAGKAGDTRGPVDSYTWRNCVASKDSNNADSIAQFVTLTNAVINCGFKPNEEGEISKIEGWHKPGKRSLDQTEGRKRPLKRSFGDIMQLAAVQVKA